jgi:hypothetical protein
MEQQQKIMKIKYTVAYISRQLANQHLATNQKKVFTIEESMDRIHELG